MQKRLLKQLKDEVSIMKQELKNCEKILERLDYQKELIKQGKGTIFDDYGINFLIKRYSILYTQLQNKIFKLETRIYILQNPDDDILKKTERCKVGCNILSTKKKKKSSLQKKK
jgi:hypothetical protein